MNEDEFYKYALLKMCPLHLTQKLLYFDEQGAVVGMSKIVC